MAISRPKFAVTGTCKFGCGRPVAPATGTGATRKFYDTCCRACAKSKGAGKHEEHCSEMPTCIIPACAEIVPASTAIESHDGKTAGASAGGSSVDDGPSRALRVLGLDDTWPSEL